MRDAREEEIVPAQLRSLQSRRGSLELVPGRDSKNGGLAPAVITDGEELRLQAEVPEDSSQFFVGRIEREVAELELELPMRYSRLLKSIGAFVSSLLVSCARP